MRLQAEYMRTSDGLHWVCIESVIEAYRKADERGVAGAKEARYFFEVVLAMAQETDPT